MPIARYFLIVIAAGALALDVPRAVAQQMVSVAREEVNLRSGPGTRYSAEWVLSRGFPLKVVGKRGDWLQVQDFENDKGWILRTLTSTTPYHIVKVKTANVRSQPTTRSRILGKVSYGDALKTLERKGGWVKIQRDGGLRGWISRALLWGW
ncbi:MAG: SH3 domain-containing protein [Reyranella sp.]